MADGRKRSGPPTDCSSSPIFPKARAICLVPIWYTTSTPRTNAPRVGWTVTGPTLAGRLHRLGFCSWVSSRKSHTTRRRGHLRVAISIVSDPSGSGRVDVLTSPVAAERAAVATEAWVKSKHDMYLIRGFRRVFTHPPEDKKNKNKTKTSTQVLLCTTTSTCSVFQSTTFFAARYSYYKSHRVSWAELREDIHRRRAFRRTTRMSEGKLVKFAHQLRPALPKR